MNARLFQEFPDLKSSGRTRRPVWTKKVLEILWRKVLMKRKEEVIFSCTCKFVSSNGHEGIFRPGILI